MAGADAIPVICIVGAGRSGSTVMTHLLGEADGVCAVGEIRNLWVSAVLQRSNCACGLPIDRCEFWSPIVDKLHLDDEVAARFIWSWQKKNLSAKSVRNLRLTRPSTQPRDTGTFELYTSLLAEIYSQIAQRSSARVIVDSSKGPIDAAVLARVPGIRPYFVHLVRDPRAVAYSWARKKAADPNSNRLFSRRGTLESAAIWFAHNVESEIVHRLDRRNAWTRVRYEDFVTSPLETVRTILQQVGVTGDKITGRTEQPHSIGGNPVRFTPGKVEIRPDQEWAERMSPIKRRIITTTMFPMLKAYGYPMKVKP